ncbi:MAG: UvrD-helicase domain-containing protein [Odoribacter sp.]|nr:UvrD-helicase domain-containing protein [Odoribacter sp.]
MLTIYKASAGSGKTFTLALQYIKLLLSVKIQGRYVLDIRKYTGRAPRARAHSHILAITFTNKATAEMKSRIIRELDALGRVPGDGESDSAYASMLTGQLGCTRVELAGAAAAALNNLLNDYSAFNVSTIDSFFQTILRNFAREIDRQGDYRLELDSDYALTAAMAMLFDDINDSGVDGLPSDPVGEWVRAMADDRLKNGQDFNPFNRDGRLFTDVTGYLKKTFDEKFEENAAAIHKFLEDPQALHRFTAAVTRLDGEVDNEIAQAAMKVAEALRAEGYSVDDLSSSVRTQVQNSMNHTISESVLANLGTAREPQYMMALRMRNPDLIKRGGFYGKKCTPSAAVDDALYAWFDTLCGYYPMHGVYKAMLKGVPTLRALSFINDYVNKFRQDNNLILIGDTNQLLDSIISESETPFIYERLGIELHNFLLDEFQDTSRLQWRNLLPLIKNSMDTNFGDSLIIGDVKQSIYRWRGGEASLLDHKVENDDFAGRNIIKGNNPGENTNYRSAHDIVRFNNTLFRSLARAGGIPGYGGVAQSLPAGTADLTSWINIVNTGCPGYETYLKSCLTDEEYQACIVNDEVSMEMAAIIMTGKKIQAEHDRGYEWRDIAVLCRRNAEASMVVDLFSRFFPDIKVISDEALLVSRAPSVRLVVSMLQILDMVYGGEHPAGVDPDDRLPVDVITANTGSMERKLSVADRTRLLMDRFEYFVSHGDSVCTALDKALDPGTATETAGVTSASIADDIADIRAAAPSNLVALVELVISKKIPHAQRMAEMPYINAFVDAVIDFSANNVPTVHSFLDYWAEKHNKLTITAPEGVDAVSIMTIHKAKGLERDCVHIPILDWNFRATPSDGWLSLEEMTTLPPEDRPPLLYLKVNKAFMCEKSPFRRQVEAQIDADSADNLNVVYVAFTRPRRELHVYMMPEGDTKQSPVTVNIIQAMLAGDESPEPYFLNLSEYVDENGNFELGRPTNPKVSGRTEPETGTVNNPQPVEAGPFNVEFRPLTRAITRVTDLTVDSGEPLDVDLGNDVPADFIDAHADTEAARLGTDLHAVLAMMYSMDDLDRSVACVASHLGEETLARYKESLEDAFEAAGECADLWFGDDVRRVLCEQTIFDPLTNENYRPDRIVWTARDTIDVVDYKFTAEASPGHHAQVRRYKAMLEGMGYRQVRAFIWYVFRKEIIEA